MYNHNQSLLPNGNFLKSSGQEIMRDRYNIGYTSNSPRFDPLPLSKFRPEPLPRALYNGNMINSAGQEILSNGYNMGYTANSPKPYFP